MIEGFVHIKNRLTKNQRKELLKRKLGHYSVINKKILFSLEDKNRRDLTIKDYILKKFSFLKGNISQITIYTDTSVHIFNYADDCIW